MVVTTRPSARNAGVMHLWTGVPSSHTVHAPQSPASQPFHPEVAQVAQALPGSGLVVPGSTVDRVAHGLVPTGVPATSARISSANR